MARGGSQLLLMKTTRGIQRIRHCGGTVAGDEDEEIASGRGRTEGERGGARVRGGKGRKGEENYARDCRGDGRRLWGKSGR